MDVCVRPKSQTISSNDRNPMINPAILAAALIGLGSAQNSPQEVDAGAQEPAPVHLEDIVVTGRRLEDLIGDFVGEVAEPNGYRGLARWEDRICVGVANLRNDAAQYVADRVSTVATDLGLEAGAPGCTPNLLIVAAADAGELARTLVSDRQRAFRMGGTGMDRGRNALNDFVETDRPVRWWQQAMPIDSETGQRAVRIPGECANECDRPEDFAPIVRVDSASRIRTQIVDRLFRTVVIVDVDGVEGVSISQLADYIAMVSLAQIDPDADTSAYASILNVFDDPGTADMLTSWDQAYLSGLYSAEQNRLNRRANRSEIADSILNQHQERRASETSDPDPAD